ncbi:hypothetical protein KEM48_002488 [Puccinia striiformis f. sp. tritici PST-130]|nr:hypothetical protein KEM48_002488 [Puccinia striiformis f. sp. tritici PST-130]
MIRVDRSKDPPVNKKDKLSVEKLGIIESNEHDEDHGDGGGGIYGRTFSGVGSNFAEGGFRHEVFLLLAPSGGRWLGDEWRVNCLIETGDLLKGSTRHEAVAQLEGRSELSSSSRLDPTAYCLGVLEESRARSINQPMSAAHSHRPRWHGMPQPCSMPNLAKFPRTWPEGSPEGTYAVPRKLRAEFSEF